MFYANIELDYHSPGKINELDAVNWERLREAAPDLDMAPQAERSEKPFKRDWNKTTFVVEAEACSVMAELGVEYKIKRFRGQMKQDRSDGKVTNVHIALPGVGLLMVDEVELLSDCCTYALASYLKEGWRIIAVCPPVDARRPDYVVGRSSYAKVER